jgi:ABC-type transport system substrate-binding protein
MVGSSILEPLAILDKEGNPEMWLAESIEPANEDFTQWDVTVKPDITFHNGEPLTAATIVTWIGFFADSDNSYMTQSIEKV